MLSIRQIVDWMVLDRFEKDRLQTIKDILRYHDIHFSIQQEPMSKNIIISLGDTYKPKTIIGAHYDVVDYSFGINDNGIAIALLIQFAMELSQLNQDKQIEIVFFDKEESGGIGSYDYVVKNRHLIEEAIILDIIGYGEEILLSGEMSKNQSMQLQHGAKQLRLGLPSDNINFELQGLPVTLITGAAQHDIYHHGDGTYGVKTKASFYRTMHNGDMDNDINIINFNLVRRVHNMLTDLFIN